MKVSVHVSFDDLPEGAIELCRSVTQRRWFESLDWYECLYSTALAGTVRPRLYVVRDDAGAVLACLFCCTREAQHRELSSLSNYYTMEFSPIIGVGADVREVAHHLAQFIGAERPLWHSVRLDYLKDSNPATAELVDALRRAGYSVRRHRQFENWYLDCAGINFDQYYAARPSRLRNTIERKGRKLHKIHDVRIELYRYPTDDILRGVHDYVTVYGSRWKRPEPHPDFIPDLARRLVANDCLRLGVLYADGRPVAAQFWITTMGEACIYKLAYDEQFADLSVGAILSREMFKQALDRDGSACIDYGVGSEAYKREWMSAAREIFGVRAYSRRTIRGMGHIFSAQLRTIARRLIPRRQ